MKALIFALLSLIPGAAFAAPIDASVQAVISSPLYPAALDNARKAVAAKGDAYVLTLGETSELHISGPKYWYYIPVLATRVPLSPDQQTVGNIVAELELIPNEPLPGVSALYFEPVAVPPHF